MPARLLSINSFENMGFIYENEIDNKWCFAFHKEDIQRRLFLSYDYINNRLYLTADRLYNGVLVSGLTIKTRTELKWLFDRLLFGLNPISDCLQIS